MDEALDSQLILGVTIPIARPGKSLPWGRRGWGVSAALQLAGSLPYEVEIDPYHPLTKVTVGADHLLIDFSQEWEVRCLLGEDLPAQSRAGDTFIKSREASRVSQTADIVRLASGVVSEE